MFFHVSQMSDRGSVALKNVRAAEGLVDMIQTTRDFRSDLGGGGWSILWREEDADRWAWFVRKILEFLKEKAHIVAFFKSVSELWTCLVIRRDWGGAPKSG